LGDRILIGRFVLGILITGLQSGPILRVNASLQYLYLLPFV
jgi:hypothetical protein